MFLDFRYILFFLFLPFLVSAKTDPEVLKLSVNWQQQSIKLPDGNDSIKILGIHQGVVFAFEATNTTQGKFLFHLINEEGSQCASVDGQVPEYAYVSKPVQTSGGLVFINKVNGKSNKLAILYWDEKTLSARWKSFENLPVSIIDPLVTFHNEFIYVGGKTNIESDSVHFFKRMIDGSRSVQWNKIPVLIASDKESHLFVQGNGVSDNIYWFTNNSSNQLGGYWFDLKEEKWKEISRFGVSINAFNGCNLGNSHILFITEGSPLVYHTITKTWIKSDSLPFADNTASIVTDNTAWYMWGEGNTGRMEIYKAIPHAMKSTIHFLDYLFFAIYFILLLIMGYFFSRRLKNTDDYFRGGKRIPWWAAGLSILVTKLSAITFMSLPVKSYTTDWLYIWIPAGNILLAIVVVRYILPFFCRLDITSTFEYLEKRFNTLTRLIGSITYIIFELARMGVLLLLPALVIAVVTDIDIYLCITLIGIIATLYTVLGGIEAVIWTDVLQVIVMVAGALVALGIVLFHIEPSNLNTFLESPLGAEKLKFNDLSIDLTNATLLVITLSWIGKIQDYVSNQAVVQRFISTKDEKNAARSMWTASILGIPVGALFLMLGTALFLFYEANPARLDPLMEKPDALLPTFILREMPAGISGLVIGAIFAAAMSSLDSAINSMSTVIITDVYKRFDSDVTEQKSLKLAKVLTIVLGAIGTGSALIMAGVDIKSLYDQLFSVIGLFGGGLAGMFILGIFTQRANSTGTLIGFFTSGLILFWVSNYTNLHVFLYALIGITSCFVIGYFSSLLTPTQKMRAGLLTIYDLKKKGIEI